jgi:two-component system sensor histidine kinase UhpB
MLLWDRLSLYWKVCLINGGVFTASAVILVVSPATVSPQVTPREMTVLSIGVAVILVANAMLLRSTLVPLDRIVARLDGFDVHRPGQRLPEDNAGITSSLAGSFNALLDRLEHERATSAARAIEAQERERRRVAQELHDEVGQRLTVVLLCLKRALDSTGEDAREEIVLAQDSARAGLEEVRRVAQGLRPGVLEDLGLTAALGAMANEVTARTHIPLERSFDSGVPPLPPDVELVIFRIAQEALTNAARHAGARHITLLLRQLTDTVQLLVRDDGQGSPQTPEREGIRGMRERALAVGAELQVRRTTAGTTVQLSIDMRTLA